ncbi:outer membrane protein assembly factor BamD [Rickettsiales bacterium]|nr:outer membrane protein assembly factor BamD [Rickettsiales bacterium]
MIFIKLVTLFIFSLSFISCSTTDSTTDNTDYSLRSDTMIYNEALDHLKRKEFELASELFTELDLQHPYSKWATKGQLMSGFALYKANKYDEAIFALSKFINLNPNNKNLPYALYLKSYCYYERIALVTRDQKFAKKAYESFTELKTKYPNSQYSKKAKNHLALLKNQLAGKEMAVGKYYQKRKKYLGAILRYKTIIRSYKKSAQIPEALFRITECYLSIGLDHPAMRFISILQYNYPKSVWFSDASGLIQKYNLNVQNVKKYQEGKSLDIEKIDIDDFNLI